MPSISSSPLPSCPSSPASVRVSTSGENTAPGKTVSNLKYGANVSDVPALTLGQVFDVVPGALARFLSVKDTKNLLTTCKAIRETGKNEQIFRFKLLPEARALLGDSTVNVESLQSALHKLPGYTNIDSAKYIKQDLTSQFRTMDADGVRSGTRIQSCWGDTEIDFLNQEPHETRLVDPLPATGVIARRNNTESYFDFSPKSLQHGRRGFEEIDPVVLSPEGKICAVITEKGNATTLQMLRLDASGVWQQYLKDATIDENIISSDRTGFNVTNKGDVFIYVPADTVALDDDGIKGITETCATAKVHIWQEKQGWSTLELVAKDMGLSRFSNEPVSIASDGTSLVLKTGIVSEDPVLLIQIKPSESAHKWDCKFLTIPQEVRNGFVESLSRNVYSPDGRYIALAVTPGFTFQGHPKGVVALIDVHAAFQETQNGSIIDLNNSNIAHVWEKHSPTPPKPFVKIDLSFSPTGNKLYHKVENDVCEISMPWEVIKQAVQAEVQPLAP